MRLFFAWLNHSEIRNFEIIYPFFSSLVLHNGFSEQNVFFQFKVVNLPIGSGSGFRKQKGCGSEKSGSGFWQYISFLENIPFNLDILSIFILLKYPSQITALKCLYSCILQLFNKIQIYFLFHLLIQYFYRFMDGKKIKYFLIKIYLKL